MAYNADMETPDYQMIRIWKTTHKRLRKIAAETDESLVELLDRMAQEEYQRVQAKERKEGDMHADHQEN